MFPTLASRPSGWRGMTVCLLIGFHFNGDFRHHRIDNHHNGYLHNHNHHIGDGHHDTSGDLIDPIHNHNYYDGDNHYDIFCMPDALCATTSSSARE